jgi:hypothetical protein
MFNGFSGKKLEVMIFLGPTYYQRLKHMVEDKIKVFKVPTQVNLADYFTKSLVTDALSSRLSRSFHPSEVKEGEVDYTRMGVSIECLPE